MIPDHVYRKVFGILCLLTFAREKPFTRLSANEREIPDETDTEASNLQILLAGFGITMSISYAYPSTSHPCWNGNTVGR